jgi:hypothetical protein
MGRAEIQIIWIPAPQTQIISSSTNDETNLKRSTNLFSTLSSEKVINFRNCQVSTSEVQTLIQKYDKVFQDLPMKLPPNRKSNI